MLKCPSCDATLDQDFGMVTCKSCKAVLMIDITGQVEVGTETTHQEQEEFTEAPIDNDFTEAPLEEDVTEAPVQAAGESVTEAPHPFDVPQTLPDETIEGGFDPVQSDFDDVMDSDLEEEPPEEFFDDPEEDQGDEIQAFQDLPDDSIQASAEEFEEESIEEAMEEPLEEVIEEPPEEEAHFEPAEEVPQDFSMPSEPDPDPVDITEFANSEQSSLEDGELVYDVTVSRLDSKDLKEALKYVLLDDKLKINHHEYLKSIIDGAVTIPDLNPIKAKRIVEQLQYYDLDIHWVQKRVVMEALEPDTSDEDEITEINEDANV